MLDISSQLDNERYGDQLCKKAYLYAIKVLARKDYSRYKLKNKIIEKDFPTELAEELVDLLYREKYLREDYYIEGRIKGFIRKGLHPHSIKQKMSEEKCPISEKDILSVMEEINVDENQILRELIEKKLRTSSEIYSHCDRYQKRDKILRFVASKGHSPIEARRVLDTLSL